jgi:hypothetical protein
MMDPVIEIDLRKGAVSSSTMERRGARFQILPVEPLRVESSVVDYAGTDSEWREVLRDIREGQPGPFDFGAESVQMTLVPERTPDSPAVPGP